MLFKVCDYFEVGNFRRNVYIVLYPLKNMEYKTKTPYKDESSENFLEESEDFVVFRPKTSSVELAVESYSAMRYHGQ